MRSHTSVLREKLETIYATALHLEDYSKACSLFEEEYTLQEKLAVDLKLETYPATLNSFLSTFLDKLSAHFSDHLTIMAGTKLLFEPHPFLSRNLVSIILSSRSYFFSESPFIFPTLLPLLFNYAQLQPLEIAKALLSYLRKSTGKTPDLAEAINYLPNELKEILSKYYALVKTQPQPKTLISTSWELHKHRVEVEFLKDLEPYPTLSCELKSQLIPAVYSLLQHKGARFFSPPRFTRHPTMALETLYCLDDLIPLLLFLDTNSKFRVPPHNNVLLSYSESTALKIWINYIKNQLYKKTV